MSMFHDIDFDELEVMFDEVKKICYNPFFLPNPYKK